MHKISVSRNIAREQLVANLVQWNNGLEAARTDHRLVSRPCLGKHSPRQKHFNQYSVTEKCVRCGLVLNSWPTEGFTRKHRETDPCSHMLTEVNRRLQESRSEEQTKTIFEEALKNCEVGGRSLTDVSDSRVGRRVGTWLGMEHASENETRGHCTCDTEDCNSSQHWRHRVRRSGNTTVDGTSPGT